jgi:hypothetical protein
MPQYASFPLNAPAEAVFRRPLAPFARRAK